jgi:hypothetical protein
MPLYTNAEAGLRPMGRAPCPSPCTRRVWVPWTVPRAACTPATPRRPRTVIGRRPPARHRPVLRTPAMPRPAPGLASTWCPSYHLNRLEPAIKALPFSTRVSTKPAAVRHRCRPGEPPTSCVPDAVRVHLALLHAPIEPAHARVDLAGLPARRSQSPRGRRRAAIGELCSPRDPRANQPI